MSNTSTKQPKTPKHANKLNNKVIKHYDLYKESIPNVKLARLTITETLNTKEETIEVYEYASLPIYLQLIIKSKVNNKVTMFLEDRVTPSNRMFFAEYCAKRGLDVNSIDDRLTLSHGMSLSDDYYIETETLHETE